MIPSEMFRACAEASQCFGHAGVVFTLPKGGMPKGFPRGELLNEMRRNGRVERTYRFPPDRVMAWLLTNGLVIVERKSETQLVVRDV